MNKMYGIKFEIVEKNRRDVWRCFVVMTAVSDRPPEMCQEDLVFASSFEGQHCLLRAYFANPMKSADCQFSLDPFERADPLHLDELLEVVKQHRRTEQVHNLATSSLLCDGTVMCWEAARCRAPGGDPALKWTELRLNFVPDVFELVQAQMSSEVEVVYKGRPRLGVVDVDEFGCAARVRFVDWGDEQVLPLSATRRLTEPLASLPPLAFPCILAPQHDHHCGYRDDVVRQLFLTGGGKLEGVLDKLERLLAACNNHVRLVRQLTLGPMSGVRSPHSDEQNRANDLFHLAYDWAVRAEFAEWLELDWPSSSSTHKEHSDTDENESVLADGAIPGSGTAPGSAEHNRSPSAVALAENEQANVSYDLAQMMKLGLVRVYEGCDRLVKWQSAVADSVGWNLPLPTYKWLAAADRQLERKAARAEEMEYEAGLRGEQIRVLITEVEQFGKLMKWPPPEPIVSRLDEYIL